MSKPEVILIALPCQCNGWYAIIYPDRLKGDHVKLRLKKGQNKIELLGECVTPNVKRGYVDRDLLDTPGAPLLLWDQPLNNNTNPDKTAPAPPFFKRLQMVVDYYIANSVRQSKLDGRV